MFISQENIASVESQLKPNVVNVLLIAEHTEFDVKALIEYANDNKLTVAGGIFPMVINNDSHYEKGIIVKHLEGVSAPLIIEGIGLGKLDFELPELDSNTHSCLILLDGLMVNIPRFLERVYEKYWTNVSYIGAGCGSLTLKQTPCIFNNTGIYQDAALMVTTSENLSLGVKHGWEKIAGPFVANKSDGNQIIELNWRPAFEVYKEVVEANSDYKFEEMDFFSISKGFPFGIYKEGKEDIVRDPISVDENGVLTCVGNISQNVALNILRGDNNKLINNAEIAANEAIKGFPKDIFVVDCISRVLYMEDTFDQELSAVKQVIEMKNNALSLEGVLSIGEISSGKDGYLELYNKTIVVSTFT